MSDDQFSNIIHNQQLTNIVGTDMFTTLYKGSLVLLSSENIIFGYIPSYQGLPALQDLTLNNFSSYLSDEFPENIRQDYVVSSMILLEQMAANNQ